MRPEVVCVVGRVTVLTATLADLGLAARGCGLFISPSNLVTDGACNDGSGGPANAL